MKKIFILTIILLGLTFKTNAQNTIKPWYLSTGVHAVNHLAVRGMFDEFFNTDNWSFVPPISQITIARSLNRSFAIDVQASIGEVDNFRLDVDNEFMVLAGAGLRYKFTNGYILSESSWFDPYVRAGLNYYRHPYRGLEFTDVTDNNGDYLNNGEVANNEFFAVSGGAGINFWIWPKIGLNIEAQYVWVPEMKSDYIDFFQAKAGLAFRFGKNDRDKDGIIDEEDDCPDVWGPKEFNGCPDTDGDKIIDKDDQCPKDPCPNGEETDEYWCENGCKKLKPKEEPKTEEPEVVVETPVEEENVLEFNDVLFAFDSADLSSTAEEKVKKAAAKIIADGGKYYFVDGFADSDGSEAYNLKLSRKRAESVRQALIKAGVKPEQLEVRAFGEAYPKCTNETEEGRQCNRRVVVLERY